MTRRALEAADQQIIARAHEHGIRVIGATLTPYQGAAYASAAGEAVREALNTWIKTSGAFDAVIDFAPVGGRSGQSAHLRARCTTIGITCIPMTPATRPWAMPSIRWSWANSRVRARGENQ